MSRIQTSTSQSWAPAYPSACSWPGQRTGPSPASERVTQRVHRCHLISCRVRGASVCIIHHTRRAHAVKEADVLPDVHAARCTHTPTVHSPQSAHRNSSHLRQATRGSANGGQPRGQPLGHAPKMQKAGSACTSSAGLRVWVCVGVGGLLGRMDKQSSVSRGTYTTYS